MLCMYMVLDIPNVQNVNDKFIYMFFVSGNV